MIYAIDFGTTNSLLGAVIDGKKIQPIALDLSAKDPSIFRSVMFFPSRKEVFYGADAIQEYVRHDMEGRFIRSIKKFLPLRTFIGTHIEDRPMNLEDIIGVFLGEMRRRANTYFKKDVDSVLLGRPARFSLDDADDQYAEYRLERAARLAGFKNIAFSPEPVAAAHEFKTTLKEEKIVFVADFGGGTSDFTIVKIGPGLFQKKDVLAIGGINLAGDALDACVMRKRISAHFGATVQYQVPFGSNILTMPTGLMEKICSPADISLLRERDTIEFFKNVQSWSLKSEDRRKMDNLFSLINEQIGFQVFEKIEFSKQELSRKLMSVIDFNESEVRFIEEITRAEFDDYTSETVEKIKLALDQTLARSGLNPGQIDTVCATGGSAKVPAVYRALENRFGKDKIQQHNHFHSIVYGLIEQASVL